MSVATQPQREVTTELTTGDRPAVTSPYVGLVPFSESDAEFFFGRKKESRIIAANLRAARLTLFYGPSGVGKSSVLRAGVVSTLREILQRDLKVRGAPDFAVVYFSTWTSDPLEGLSKAIREAVKASLEQDTIDDIPPTRSLVEIVKTWTERYGIELLVILDQFEEYFLYHGDESGPGTFADEFPGVINDPYLRARFLISMRDDTLSRLDRFKSSIPNLFDNRLQIDYLDLASAREAVIEPVRKYNRLYAKENPFVFDHDQVDMQVGGNGSGKFLVDEVLSQVQVGKVTIGVTGQGAVKKEKGEDDPQTQAFRVPIEAPYLQLVMMRIWNDETTINTHQLKADTLDKLGGSQQIVEEHLDKFMEGLSEPEQDVAARVFYYLVTPSGEKIAHTVETLAEYTGRRDEEVEPLLEKLLKLSEGKEEYRILRKIDVNPGKEAIRYAVFHDALAPAVLAWSEKHQNEKNKRKEAAKARDWIVVTILIGLVILALIFMVNEEQQRLAANLAEAQLQQEKSEAMKREADLIAQRETLKPYKETIQSLVALTSGSAERKEAAISTLRGQIENKKLDPELVPLINPLLEQVAKTKTQAGIEAREAVNEFAQQAQDTRLSPRVYIQIQDDGQLEKARLYQQQLNAGLLSNIPNVRQKIIAPSIQNVGTRKSVTMSELRYFHSTDLERQIGEQLIQILHTAGLTAVYLRLVKGYEDNPDIRPNHFELWLSSDVR